MAADLTRYRRLLGGIEKEAREQPWHDERPWLTKTHVFEEHGAVVVDLHDLRANLVKRLVKAIVDADPPAAGALVLVHGLGQHSRVPGGVLKGVVTEALGPACAKRPGWALRPGRPGRTVWITDRKRAPKAVIGGGGSWLTAGIVLFVSLFVLAVLSKLGFLEEVAAP